VFALARLHDLVAARLPSRVPLVGFWTQSAASYATHLAFTRDHAALKGQDLATLSPRGLVPLFCAFKMKSGANLIFSARGDLRAFCGAGFATRHALR
jgi:hypothetical protein